MTGPTREDLEALLARWRSDAREEGTLGGVHFPMVGNTFARCAADLEDLLATRPEPQAVEPRCYCAELENMEREEREGLRCAVPGHDTEEAPPASNTEEE